MTHAWSEAEMDAYLDSELAGKDALEMEKHIAGCADCTRLTADRKALRAAIAAHAPRVRAPDALRARVKSSLRAAVDDPGLPLRRSAWTRSWRPLAVAASLVVVAVGSWRLALRQAEANRIADDVLTSHVRSLMPGHLTDVPSSDQHTVKPWFNGRLDFSPPVDDFAAQGYPLIGGRLDYVNGRGVAALVYGRRRHVINVFVWPGSNPITLARPADRQGYHTVVWRSREYVYWAVSDVATPELEAFAGLIQGHQ
jgi:anti-sigma factor RsiW